MHPLHLHILDKVKLSEFDFEKLLSHFEKVHLVKGDYLIDPGTVVKHQYYVLKGCLRTYMIDPEGKEHTIQFAAENWWVSDYISYYKKVSSSLVVECLENCELLKINIETLNVLFDEIPMIERFFRKQLENAFVAFQTRILSSLHQTADQRYEFFIKSYPNLEKRVKNYHIASYLGITPESLSRLRKLRLDQG